MSELSENFDEQLNHKDSILNVLNSLGLEISADNITGGVFGSNSNTTGIEFGINKSTYGKTYIQSKNFVSGTTGWQLLSDGSLEASSGTFRGTLSGNSLAIGANGIHIDTSGNMWWGSSTTYAGATIKISSAGSVDFTTGTFSGAISGSAISGATITGSIITTGTVGANVKIELSRFTVRTGTTEVFVGELGTYGGFFGINNTSGTNVLSIYPTNTTDVYLITSLGDLIIQSFDDVIFVGSAGNNIYPATNNVMSLGLGSNKWSDVQTTLINGTTPLAGNKEYYVADSSGGAVTRKLTFSGGILTSET